MMQLATSIARMVRSEACEYGVIRLVKCGQAPDGTPWVLLSGALTSEGFLKEALEALFAGLPGFALYTTSGDKFVSPDGFPPQRDVMTDDDHEALALMVREVHGGEPIPSGDAVLYCVCPGIRPVVDATAVRTVLAKDTWFASRCVPPRLANRQIVVVVGAQRVVVAKPSSELAVAEDPNRGLLVGVFQTEPSRHSLDLRWWSANGECGVHTVRVDEILSFSGVLEQSSEYVRIDIPIGVHCWFMGQAPINSGQTILEAVRSSQSLMDVVRSSIRQALTEARRRKLLALEARRERLARRPSVWLGPTRIGKEPQNETETIILAVRLEDHLRSLLGVFKVLEHTSQEGIDAIAEVRLAPDAPAETVFLEFEFHLSGFFTHGHALRQTRCIVCWAVGEPDRVRAEANGWSLANHYDGWSYLLSAADHVVRVIALSRLPSLRVQ